MNPETLTFDLVKLIGVLAASFTVAGLLIKLGWTFIDLKWRSESKDTITRNQLEEFCTKAQMNCPKSLELARF